MLHVLIQFMILPVTYIWQSEAVKEGYKYILVPLSILYIPIGLVIGLVSLFIIFPLVEGYFKLRNWYRRKKRRNAYRNM